MGTNVIDSWLSVNARQSFSLSPGKVTTYTAAAQMIPFVWLGISPEITKQCGRQRESLARCRCAYLIGIPNRHHVMMLRLYQGRGSLIFDRDSNEFVFEDHLLYV